MFTIGDIKTEHIGILYFVYFFNCNKVANNINPPPESPINTICFAGARSVINVYVSIMSSTASFNVHSGIIR